MSAHDVCISIHGDGLSKYTEKDLIKYLSTPSNEWLFPADNDKFDISDKKISIYTSFKGISSKKIFSRVKSKIPEAVWGTIVITPYWHQQTNSDGSDIDIGFWTRDKVKCKEVTGSPTCKLYSLSISNLKYSQMFEPYIKAVVEQKGEKYIPLKERTKLLREWEESEEDLDMPYDEDLYSSLDCLNTSEFDSEYVDYILDVCTDPSKGFLYATEWKE